MNQFRRGYNRIVYLTSIALVMITLGIEYFQYHRNQHLVLIDLRNRLDEHTSNVNLRARTVQGYVNGLKTAAENMLFYIKKFGMTSPLIPFIKNDPKKKSYYLEVKDLNIDKALLSNLTGLGSIEGLSESLKVEINMALMLNTFFEMALKNVRGAVWVYYTSNRHLQNLYPWLPLNINTYCSALRDKLFFLEGTPQRNPGRLNFWTPAYQDGAADGSCYQQGIVVTNSSPVYDGGTFLGTVSLDLSVSELERVMSRFEPLQGALFLINKEYQILAAKGVDPALLPKGHISFLEKFVAPEVFHKIVQEIKEPSGWFFFNNSSLIYVTSLNEAPWYIVYVGSKSDLFMQAFVDALVDIFVIISTLLFVVGMGYLIVIRDFISPAQKLVDHIANENRGEESTPQNLPSRWRPWFDIVSRIFAENRALLEDLEHRVKLRTKQLQHKNHQLEKTLTDLKKAQSQILVQEKLASLGALTAGIAHEIKNPLNFVINFSDLSLEYLQELKEKVSNENELFNLIEQNMAKTREHAERADSIVKSMLSHARGSTGEITTFNLNKLLEETIELAYVGFQGKEHHFTAILTKDFDDTIGDIQGSKQDLARVFLNIVNNACFAMHEKKEKQDQAYKPALLVTSQNRGETVEIIFEDNGTGMRQSVMRKIFHPFFTTKESGKGTGLGLSLSYDIIVHQHHGQLRVESKIGEYSRFIIDLPKHMEGFHE